MVLFDVVLGIYTTNYSGQDQTFLDWSFRKPESELAADMDSEELSSEKLQLCRKFGVLNCARLSSATMI